jgi:hypothetical protein
MECEFEFCGVKYKILSESKYVIELRVYYDLTSINYCSSLKRIKNGKIVWHDWDEQYLSKYAMIYCDRYIKNIIFS